MTDIRDALRRAAPHPTIALDEAELHRRVHRRRRRRRAGVAGTAAVAITAGMFAVSAAVGESDRPDDALGTAITGQSTAPSVSAAAADVSPNEPSVPRYMTAHLSTSGDEVTVDLGEEQGIVPGVGVYRFEPEGGLREQGLLGVVDDTQATSSTVRLLGVDGRLAVRAAVVFTDALAEDRSGFSWVEGTVRTLGDEVVFTLDALPSDDVADRIVGGGVTVDAGTGGLLLSKYRIGTIVGLASPADPSTFLLRISDVPSDGEVTVIIP
jgi:hypothetical protein